MTRGSEFHLHFKEPDPQGPNFAQARWVGLLMDELMEVAKHFSGIRDRYVYYIESMSCFHGSVKERRAMNGTLHRERKKRPEFSRITG